MKYWRDAPFEGSSFLHQVQPPEVTSNSGLSVILANSQRAKPLGQRSIHQRTPGHSQIVHTLRIVTR